MPGIAHLVKRAFTRVASGVLLHCLIAAALAAEAEPADSVRNGGFEQTAGELGSSGKVGEWSAVIHGQSDAKFSIVGGGGIDGSRCVQYERTTDGNDNLHLDQIVPVRPDTIYELRAWVRSDGRLRPLVWIAGMDWKPIARLAAGTEREWTEIRFPFLTGGDVEQVRFQWFAGADGQPYRGLPGRSWLDEVSIRPLLDPPAELREAFELVRPKPGQEIDPATVKHARVGEPRPLRPVRCRDGVLVYEDGSELALWGVNLQTALFWEYRGRMKRCGIPLDAEALKRIADRNLDEMQQLGVGVIRMHLCPSDFTDGDGGLEPTVFLDLLDYTIAGCCDRGIYVYLTLLNELGAAYVEGSFFQPAAGMDRDVFRKMWSIDEDCIEKTEVNFRELFKRVNPYTRRAYKDEAAIALIEVMNEPRYVSYDEMMADPHWESLAGDFRTWLGVRHLDAWPETYYHRFRYERVKRYLESIHRTIRETGARQPVAWNLNWPRMIRGHEDVFQAVADSPVEVVSFCLYPGQDDVPQPFWQHPVNLDGKNYLPFLRANWRQYERLRWVLGTRFAGKAKAVYEFETFYNQTSYLYPAMARLFRALGVQVANMWTYSLTPTAERLGGSHHLNLYCTPRKAVSFMIAGELFERTSRYTPYDATADDNLVFGKAAVSFEHDLSLLGARDLLMHSGSIGPWRPIEVRPDVQRIVGVGDSPLVSYGGSGAYFLEISSDRIELLIHPDARFVRPHWRRSQGTPWETVCELDSATEHRFELRLPGWRDGVRVVRMDGDGREVAATGGETLSFGATPGRYRIVRAGSGSAE